MKHPAHRPAALLSAALLALLCACAPAGTADPDPDPDPHPRIRPGRRRIGRTFGRRAAGTAGIHRV